MFNKELFSSALVGTISRCDGFVRPVVFDRSIMGICSNGKTQKTLPLYDYKKCIEILSQTLSNDDARVKMEEIMNTWYGADTPCFINFP